MKSAGYRVGNPDELRESISGRFPVRSEAPSVLGRTSQAWETARKAERAAATADVHCRRSVYEAAVTHLAPKLDDFLEAQGPALTRVRASWADLVKQAAAG
jgi:hypothetical protein